MVFDQSINLLFSRIFANFARLQSLFPEWINRHSHVRIPVGSYALWSFAAPTPMILEIYPSPWRPISVVPLLRIGMDCSVPCLQMRLSFSIGSVVQGQALAWSLLPVLQVPRVPCGQAVRLEGWSYLLRQLLRFPVRLSLWWLRRDLPCWWVILPLKFPVPILWYCQFCYEDADEVPV